MKVAYYRYSTDNKNQVDNSEVRQRRETVERMIIRRAKEEWGQIGSFTDRAVSGTDDNPELLKLRAAVE